MPEAYLGAVAGTVRRCAKLLEALEDELNKPSAGQATDDAGRSETEASDGDDVALDDTPPRHLPEGVVYLRAAFDDVIEALSAAYGARERDWLENALERVVRRLPEGDDYASLLEGPLQGRAVAVEGLEVVAEAPLARRGAPFSIRSDEQRRPLALVGEEVRAGPRRGVGAARFVRLGHVRAIVRGRLGLSLIHI